MHKADDNVDVFREYLGFSGRSVAIFLAVSVATVAVVTCLYTAIFGYDTWRNNMSQAGSLMLSNFDVPPTDPATGAPVNNGVAPVAAAGGCQFLCPSCGVVDLPTWNANGDPICPSCGGLLGVGSGGGTAAKLAASP